MSNFWRRFWNLVRTPRWEPLWEPSNCIGLHLPQFGGKDSRNGSLWINIYLGNFKSKFLNKKRHIWIKHDLIKITLLHIIWNQRVTDLNRAFILSQKLQRLNFSYINLSCKARQNREIGFANEIAKINGNNFISLEKKHKIKDWSIQK